MPHKDPLAKLAYDRAWRAKHRERLLQYQRAYNLANAERIARNNHANYLANKAKRLAQDRARYYAHHEARKTTDSAYRAAHRAEALARTKAWRLANPEKRQANQVRRRAMKKGSLHNDLSAAQWHEIKEAYGYRCVYCDRKMQRLTQDHIIPLSKGGLHTLSNVVPACQTCNVQKSINRPPIPVQPLLFTLAPARTYRKRRKAS